MGEMEQTREQLAQDLAQARKRIAELETARGDDFRTLPVGYDTFKAFFESATDSFSIWDSNMKMVYINDITLEKYYPAGTTRADIIGKHFTELIPGSIESGRYERYLNVLKTGDPVYIDEFTPHPRFGDMYLSIKVFKIENGLGVITTDITERKRMEQELQDSRQRLSALINNAPDIIFSYDTDGRILSLNKRAEELLGYTSKEVVGKTFSESNAFTAESLAKAEKRIKSFEQGQVTTPTPYELIAKDGTHIFLEVRAVLTDRHGKPEVIAIARDITERRKIEDALRQSEEKLHAIFQSIGDSITVIDGNGKIIEVNDAAIRLFGCRSREEALGTNALSFIEEEYTPSAFDKLQDGKPVRFIEYEYKRMDGSTFWGETSSDVLYDASGNITGFIGIVRDITDHKKAEEALHLSEERYRRLAEDMPALICTFLPDSTLTYVNKSYSKYFKKPAEELLGTRFLDFIPDDEERRKVIDRYASLTAEVPVVTYEHKVETPDGKIRWQQWTDRALFNEAGEITGYQSIGFDTTERNQMEESLRHSEEKLRAIFESIGDGVSIINMQGKVVEVNETALRTSGYSKEEFLSKNGLELIAEKDRARAYDEMYKAFEVGYTRPIEFAIVRKDGTEYPGEATSTILRDNSGNPIGLVSVLRDITERRQMEEKLRRSEEKLRRIFESIGDAITIVDMNGMIIDANETARRMAGYSREDHIGRYGLEMLVEKDRDRAKNSMAEAIAVGHKDTEEYTVLRADGTVFPAETKSTVLHDSSGKPIGLINILRDVTERKYMEEKLRESEEKIRQIFDSVGVGITVTDMEGKVTEINDFSLRIHGYSKEALIGQNGIRLIAEKDRPRIIETMIQAFKTGQSSIQEFISLKKDGTEYDVEAIATVLRDASGKPTGLIISITDITERKRIEKELNDYKENLERMVEKRTSELEETYEELRESEERLKISEEKLRTMFASMADGVVVTDLEGKVKDANTALLNMFGYNKEEVLGLNGFDFIAEEDRDLAMNDVPRLFSDGLITGRSWTFKHRSERKFKAELSTALLKNANGNPTDILVVMRDITERKRMEEALRASEEKLRAIYDSIGDGITVTDLKGTIMDQNEAGLRLSGYSGKGDVVGRNGLLFIAETDRDRARNDMFNVLQKGIGITTEYKLVNKNGKEFDAEVSGAIITGGEGQPAAIVNVIRDITDRKHIEEALRESESKYRTLVEQSEQGICILQNGRVVFANNALAKINGSSLKEMYAMSPDELLLTVHPDDREAYVERVTRRLQGEKMMPRHEYRMIRKDGAKRQLETYAKRITYKGQPAIQSTIEDITERKKWEAQLNKSKEELRFYVSQITKAQEEERKRIARELHDDTIQELITLSRQLDDLIGKRISPAEDRRNSRKKIEQAQQKVAAILQSVRSFTRELRPSILDDLGLVPALEWLTSDMSNRFGIPVNISIIGKEQPASPDAALTMFRIAQESLRNAGQHSKASQIQLNLKFTSKTATLSVIDDGKGFTPSKQISSLTKLGKLGIAGMYERAQLIGATLSIKSKRKEGTTITLEVPLK